MLSAAVKVTDAGNTAGRRLTASGGPGRSGARTNTNKVAPAVTRGANAGATDTVTLIVSTGPPLFEIPNVVGQTRDGAIAALEDAGFQVDYAVFFAAIPDSLTEVVSMDPGAGEFVVRGTRIYIQLTVTG